MKRSIYYCLSILVLSVSCRTFEIDEKDLELIPYSRGEILVFESDKKEVDTIFITGFDSLMADSDPLAILPDKQEIYRVNYRLNESKYNQELMKLQGSRNHEITIWFDITLGKIKGLSAISKKELKELPNISWVFNNKTLKDVKTLESNLIPESDQVKIFWSISEGLMGLESDFGTWRLIKKYVP